MFSEQELAQLLKAWSDARLYSDLLSEWAWENKVDLIPALGRRAEQQICLFSLFGIVVLIAICNY